MGEMPTALMVTVQKKTVATYTMMPFNCSHELTYFPQIQLLDVLLLEA